MRRDYLRWVISGVLVALVGCGGNPIGETPTAPAPEEANATASPAPSATPTPFKPELVICMSNEPDTLLGGSNDTARAIRVAVAPGAVQYGEDYTAEPLLLESLPSIEDGTLRRNEDGTIAVTLKYREDLVWSDGTPFAAADAMLGLSLPSSPLEPIFDVIEAEQVDDFTLEVTAADGAEYPYVPSQPPLPSHHEEVQSEELSQTTYTRIVNPSLGPYFIAERAAGDYLLLNANPHYQPAPRIPVVRIRFAADILTALREVQQNDCDVVFAQELTPEQFSAAFLSSGAQPLEAMAWPGPQYEQLIFNTFPDPFISKPYLADVRLRRAVAYALNWETLDQLYAVDSSHIVDSWLSTAHWVYPGSETLAQYPFDVDRANALLNEVGWVDQDGDGVREYHGQGGEYSCQRGEWQIEEGTPLAPVLLTTDDPMRTQVAESLRVSLSQIGMRVEVQTLPAAALFASDGPIIQRAFDLALFSAITRPDPGGISRWVGADVFLHPLDRIPVHRWQLEERWLQSEQQVERLAYSNTPSAENAHQGQNFSGWCNEEADLAIVGGNRTLNLEEKRQLYAHHQSLLATEVPVLPLFVKPRFAAAEPYMCGFISPAYDPLTWNLGDWYFSSSGRCE